MENSPIDEQLRHAANSNNIELIQNILNSSQEQSSDDDDIMNKSDENGQTGKLH